MIVILVCYFFAEGQSRWKRCNNGFNLWVGLFRDYLNWAFTIKCEDFIAFFAATTISLVNRSAPFFPSDSFLTSSFVSQSILVSLLILISSLLPLSGSSSVLVCLLLLLGEPSQLRYLPLTLPVYFHPSRDSLHLTNILILKDSQFKSSTEVLFDTVAVIFSQSTIAAHSKSTTLYLH